MLTETYFIKRALLREISKNNREGISIKTDKSDLKVYST